MSLLSNTTAKRDITKKSTLDKNISMPFFGNRLSKLELILAIQNLSVMLESGLSLEDSFDVVIDQSTNLKLKTTLADVLKTIKSGETLYNSMKAHTDVFSPLILSVINAGEQGGTLETNLKYLGDFLKKDYDLKKKVKGALFYPILVFGMCFIEGIAVVFFILPQLENFFSSLGKVPPTTKIILEFGKFMRVNVVPLSISSVLLLIGIFIFVRGTKPGKYVKDYVSLSIPIMSKLTKSFTLSTFSRTMGILLESGQPVYNALIIASETLNNRLYSSAIERIKNSVMSGVSISDSFAENQKYFPPLFIKMVAVGERAGILEKNFISLNNYYSNDAEDISNNFATLIEPIMLIFVGIVVAILAVTVIAPLYQVVASMQMK